MDLAFCRARLEAHAEAIAAAVKHVAPDQARWRPEPAKWSILEVVRHLADEERDDFRMRVDLTLHRPGAAWPPIDPERWAVERRYNDGDLQEALEDYLRERKASLVWLSGLRDPDWKASYTIPSFGPMEAGSLMASWVAHDVLHLRQLAALQYRYLAGRAEPYKLDYAGKW